MASLDVFVILVLLSGTTLEATWVSKRVTLEENNGWTIENPIMGLVLVTLENEKIWFVPKTPYGSSVYEAGLDTIDAQSDFIEKFNREPSFFYTSTIYTARRNGTGLTNNMIKLNTKYHYFKGTKPSDISSIREINSLVSDQTYGKIPEFIPIWDHPSPVISQSTAAVYLNTFAYKNQWASRWRDKGEGYFFIGPKGSPEREEKVRFLQTEGTFRYFELTDKTAFGVYLPLKGGKKFLRLTRYQDLNKNPVNLTPGQKIRVRVPAISLRSFGHFDHDKYGVEVCQIDANDALGSEAFSVERIRRRNPYFVQPLVQAHAFDITTFGLTIATVTANQISSMREYADEFFVDNFGNQTKVYPDLATGITKTFKIPPRPHPDPDGLARFEKIEWGDTHFKYGNNTFREMVDLAVKEPTKGLTSDGIFHLTFDQPFSMSLYEPESGQAVTAHIATVNGLYDSSKQSKFVRDSEESKRKLKFGLQWSCD